MPRRGGMSSRASRAPTRRSPPLLCHVGRAFITKVTLALGPKSFYRTRSYTNISTAELLARPGSTGRTLDSFLKATGRVEIIHFPFTSNAWLKTWERTATKPTSSRAVTSPFNYTFADNPGSAMVSLFSMNLALNPSSVLLLGPQQLSAVQQGLSQTATTDIWGTGPDTMLYVKPTTLKVTANGYAVLCRRADVQRVANEFWNYYKSLTSRYQLLLQYPINGPIEIRVTGVDNPEDSGVWGAVDPALSPTRRRLDHPEWDTVVWFDVLTMPGTMSSNSYYADMERWFYSNYSSYAGVRVEWSKGWGYTSSGGWSDSNAFSSRIPSSFNDGGMTLQQAADALDALDPKRIFSAPLHNRLLP